LQNGSKMTKMLMKFWQSVIGQVESKELATISIMGARPSRELNADFQFTPNDPLLAHFLNAPGTVEVDKLNFDSPALKKLKEAGVRFVVPLIGQGELIGLLNLGARLSEQDYSGEDQRLLNNLASQAAPALRVAQLVRQQHVEARERERLEQELRVARIIQETLLPKEVPVVTGWRMAAYWQPARAVGGDFYDFIDLPDGRLGLVIGDVTDKGVPAALVMATTRSVLRAAAERFQSPGQVLERSNNLLCVDIPRNMFVTCLYAILDPASGRIHYANAGHNLPFWRRQSGVEELRATGMPLGLMPDLNYEENETHLALGESILLYSDGLVEAHNLQREMFSFNRLRELVGIHPGGTRLIEFLLAELAEFTGEEWEQEDDVTFVTLERLTNSNNGDQSIAIENQHIASGDRRILAEFQLPSEPGRERQAVEHVAVAVTELHLPSARLEKLKTAVAEATMNAIEHGNHFRPELPVSIKVLASEEVLTVSITDKGGDQIIPEKDAPNLEAKLAGLQSPRGWGLFLIKNMVDEMKISTDQSHHTVELNFLLKGGQDASQST